MTFSSNSVCLRVSIGRRSDWNGLRPARSRPTSANLRRSPAAGKTSHFRQNERRSFFYRHSNKSIGALLGHPGAPFWRNKDLASWSIPKGLIAEGEIPLAAAKREFTEETGHRPRGSEASWRGKTADGENSPRMGRGGDWDAGSLKSNMFEMEWPPRSGRRQNFPELDRAGCFGVHEALSKILKGKWSSSIVS